MPVLLVLRVPKGPLQSPTLIMFFNMPHLARRSFSEGGLFSFYAEKYGLDPKSFGIETRDSA